MMFFFFFFFSSRRRHTRFSRDWSSDVCSSDLDGFPQVRRSSIVEKELPLAQAPQGRGAKLVSSRVALEDVVGQSRTHAMQQQIGIEIDRLLVERRAGGLPRREGRRVAHGADDPVEQ